MVIAKLVYDSLSEKLEIPPEVLPEGGKFAHHFQSTDMDNLIELSGKICYDSCKNANSRNSEEYHAHIASVGHFSVLEHANFTVEFDTPIEDEHIPFAFLSNRVGVWHDIKEHLQYPQLLSTHRLTLNLRTLVEYEKYDMHWFRQRMKGYAYYTFHKIYELIKEKSPLILQNYTLKPQLCDIFANEKLSNFRLATPERDNEVWVSFYMSKISRNLLQELVRHGDNTAFSVRSTRFCDESESDIIWHPLSTEYSNKTDEQCLYHAEDITETARSWYNTHIKEIQGWLTEKGTDKLTARKQARAAARAILPSALETELIMSANLTQWKHMIQMRASRHADAEIRVLFNRVYESLQDKFPERFTAFTTKTCPDGIGYEVEV